MRLLTAILALFLALPAKAADTAISFYDGATGFEFASISTTSVLDTLGGYTFQGSTTLPNNISGAASSATAIAVPGSICPVGQYARGVDVFTNAVNCTIDAGAGGGISNVVEDLTPQLGGDLDGLDQQISNVSTVTVNGQVQSSDGAAAAPAYTFTGDNDTGLYRPAADEVSISGNGLEHANFAPTAITFNRDLVSTNAVTLTSPTGNLTSESSGTFSGVFTDELTATGEVFAQATSTFSIKASSGVKIADGSGGCYNFEDGTQLCTAPTGGSGLDAEWELQESRIVTNSTSESFAVNPNQRYLIRAILTLDDNGSGGSGRIGIRFNSESGSIYAAGSATSDVAWGMTSSRFDDNNLFFFRAEFESYDANRRVFGMAETTLLEPNAGVPRDPATHQHRNLGGFSDFSADLSTMQVITFDVIGGTLDFDGVIKLYRTP